MPLTSPFPRAPWLPLALGALLLAGCATPPADADRAVVLPAAWRSAAPAAAQAGAADAQWWRGFGSAELDELIERAQAGNHDLEISAARVQAARAQARIAGAALLPTLAGTVDASRDARLGGRGGQGGDSNFLGFAARYELDLWGRLEASRREALQGLRASEFDRDAARLGLNAQVASAWLQRAALRERETIARDNLDNARRVLRLVASRHAAGAATPLELAQQRGLVAARQRELLALGQQAADAQTALALLFGLPSSAQGGVPAGDARLEALRVPAIDAGLPSELLARRPDIAFAEARLAAADANVQAARAALLPSVSLSATLGWRGGSGAGNPFDNPAYGLVAGLAAPVFDGGRLRGEQALAEARREELLQAYRRSIAAAFADTETALNGLAGLDAQAEIQAEELLQARRAAELSESRYRAGAETLLALLDAQRTLYGARDQQVQLLQSRLQARVALYRALGGGWREAPPGGRGLRAARPGERLLSRSGPE
ncbi:efflux transporter outer membrane subunit [Variovorax sp. CY25R-8]|uniref:efflux transporter outer membrane subunit n=1 Tax=Variovorax sp. CY25R-8 TaxID=2855501 RepID=UPI0021BB5967|nr:efflux transporter outer membrane subunit [Variovorax sp. CY25R-8]MCT8179010.1 efflux transporter outer membrane subunit [Variovorax sp. CY25R-8]